MAKAEPAGELLVLILSNGMPSADLTAVLENLKNSSKSIGTHKRRELYWQAYTKLINKASSMEGSSHCMLLFRTTEDGEGAAEVTELTKRQKGLVSGGCEFVGVSKLKPPDDPKSKAWCMAFSEDEAQRAWDDFMSAEPCVVLTADGVYVATRYKRELCKALSGLPKTVKEAEELVSGLAPEKPLKSVSFTGHDPPKINGYNVFLAGSSALGPSLPSSIGHVGTAGSSDVYDYFLERKNKHNYAEAGKLIAQMITDVNKGQQPIIAASQKEAGVAYKNALMKRVFVHEGMKKFVDRVRADGQVEMTVITGELDAESDFGKYGGLVFELFYRGALASF